MLKVDRARNILAEMGTPSTAQFSKLSHCERSTLRRSAVVFDNSSFEGRPPGRPPWLDGPGRVALDTPLPL